MEKEIAQKDVFGDLEELIQDNQEEQGILQEASTNFSQLYLPRLTQMSHSLEVFEENQQQMDEQLQANKLAGYQKKVNAVKRWWIGTPELSLDDLHEMQKKALEYMRSTLEETLDASKKEGDQLAAYAKDLLGKLKKGDVVLKDLDTYFFERPDGEVSLYEQVRLDIDEQDHERKKQFGLTRLHQFMQSQVEHYHDVRSLVGALREVVEVYTLVRDGVVVGAQNLEVVMAGHKVMDHASQMSPRYQKGVQQLGMFRKELNRRLRLGLKRLHALRSTVTVKSYVP